MDMLVRALSSRDTLSDEEIGLIRSVRFHTQRFGRGQTIMDVGSYPQACFLVRSGLAAHEHTMLEGGRQITSIGVPGDLMGLSAYLLKQTATDVVALTDCEVDAWSYEELGRLVDTSPHLARLIWMWLAIEGASHRAALASMGRTSATARIGHLYCEIYLRLRQVGLAAENRFDLDLRQEQVADICGLSLVHVNRSLKVLRDKRLIRREGTSVILEDWTALLKEADFDGTYLSLFSAAR